MAKAKKKVAPKRNSTSQKRADGRRAKVQPGDTDERIAFGDASEDLLIVSSTFSQVEDSHGMTETNWKPTPEFLRDLVGACERLGFAGVTPTQAYRIWHETGQKMIDLQKKTDSQPS